MSLSLNSHLLLVPVEIRKDKKNYIVEDKTTGKFYEMPKICIDAILLINRGVHLGAIEKQLQEKYPNEEVDLLNFAELLIEMYLIAELDGEKIERNPEQVSKEKLGFVSIPPKIGKLFFNKIAYYFYSALFLLNLFFFISKPSLFPNYKDLFVFEYITFNIPTWLIITFILVLIHESGHVLAMRAYNLPTKLEVGHRLFLVVLETDMESAWKLSSIQRNVLYLAGVCFDTVILSVALVSQLASLNGSGFIHSIMNIIILDTFIRMVYQLCIYMKTDFYYVLENISGCYNLMENAQHLIKKKLPMLYPKKEGDEDEVFAGEKKNVILYSFFYFIGVVLMVALYIFFFIPQLLYAWKKVLPGFSYGINSYAFWDAIVFSLQVLVGVALLLYSWRKKYLQR